jgi:dihydroorotate dehydrogenase (NAD+) catalytic subunit
VALTRADPLSVVAAGLNFQNPIVVASGVAGYGRELLGVTNLDRLGGFVTKAVSVEPRKGNSAMRVAEIKGGMINAVGLANPGLEAVRTQHVPWMASHLPNARKLVNVVGNTIEDYARVVGTLELSASPSSSGRAGGIDAYELNLSCPNVKQGGLEFSADPATMRAVIVAARAETSRPIFVKLSPTLPNIAESARQAVDAGADGLTLINTIPGMLIDVEHRRPRLGFGTGGVSGAAILPVGVLATWKASRAVQVPIIGVGGVSSAEDALQYILAGATLVGVGTAAFRDPRTPERIVKGLRRWCKRHRVASISELVGTLEWSA